MQYPSQLDNDQSYGIHQEYGGELHRIGGGGDGGTSWPLHLQEGAVNINKEEKIGEIKDGKPSNVKKKTRKPRGDKNNNNNNNNNKTAKKKQTKEDEKPSSYAMKKKETSRSETGGDGIEDQLKEESKEKKKAKSTTRTTKKTKKPSSASKKKKKSTERHRHKSDEYQNPLEVLSSPIATSSNKVVVDDDDVPDLLQKDQRLKDEMQVCQQMKVRELKEELEKKGISVTSFIEKSDFVKALAEARINTNTYGGGENNINMQQIVVVSSPRNENTANHNTSSLASSPLDPSIAPSSEVKKRTPRPSSHRRSPSPDIPSKQPTSVSMSESIPSSSNSNKRRSATSKYKDKLSAYNNNKTRRKKDQEEEEEEKTEEVSPVSYRQKLDRELVVWDRGHGSFGSDGNADEIVYPGAYRIAAEGCKEGESYNNNFGGKGRRNNNRNSNSLLEQQQEVSEHSSTGGRRRRSSANTKTRRRRSTTTTSNHEKSKGRKVSVTTSSNLKVRPESTITTKQNSTLSENSPITTGSVPQIVAELVSENDNDDKSLKKENLRLREELRERDERLHGVLETQPVRAEPVHKTSQMTKDCRCLIIGLSILIFVGTTIGIAAKFFFMSSSSVEEEPSYTPTSFPSYQPTQHSSLRPTTD